MEEHLRFEESIERDNKILRNIWIRENKALTDSSSLCGTTRSATTRP